MRKIAIVLALLMIIMTFASCSNKEEGSELLGWASSNSSQSDSLPPTPDENQSSGQSGTQTTTAFPSFSTVDLDGNAVTQDIFKEYDITMVNIWATWCNPCISEIPYISQVADSYANKNVNVIGILGDGIDLNTFELDEDAIANAKQILEQTSATYKTIVPDTEIFLNILASLQYYPTTFFIDSNGNIIGEPYIGAHDYDDWSAIIDELLE